MRVGNGTQLSIWPVLRGPGILAAMYLSSCAVDVLTADQESVTAAALLAEVAVEEASRLPIELHWTSDVHGQSSATDLQFEIENTTDGELDVALHVASQLGSKRSALPVSRLKVGAHGRSAQKIAVDQLGMQTVGRASTAQIAAVFTASEGLERASFLPTLWVEHEAGFGRAKVRDVDAEASANAARSFGEAHARRAPQAARLRDSTGRQREIERAELESSWDDSQVIGGAKWLPDVGTPKRQPDAKPATVDDASNPSAPVREDEMIDKGGDNMVCFRVPYLYVDSNMGEDQLKSQGTTTEGLEPARYMWGTLQNSAGTVFWNDWLDSGGCTPYINHANGTFTGIVRTALYRPASDVGVDVLTTDTAGFTGFMRNYTITSSGQVFTLDMNGNNNVWNAAVSVANAIYRATPGFSPGMRTLITTDQSCPSFPNSACTTADGTRIFLGTGGSSVAKARFKTIVHHELGHAVQSFLSGHMQNSSTIDATQAVCRCDHVTSSNQAHCLQSRSTITAAQIEGWGHFLAARSLNNGFENNCTFGYYKEFKNDDLSTSFPPMIRSCFNQVKWMANRCQGSNRGTEWDWMDFYWRVANKDGIGFGDFNSLYRSACGGQMCNNNVVTFSQTNNAASAVFGNGSAKAIAWSTQSANFGVNF